MKTLFTLLIATMLTVAMFAQNSGEIIITEIMQNPNDVLDGDGEYFEIYNTMDVEFDLIDWTISDNGSDIDTIDMHLLIPANGFIVLGINADMSSNGGIPVDYEYSEEIALGNGSDELVLKKADETVIDEVAWDNGNTFPDPNGRSMNLDPEKFNATDNDDGNNWCESTTLIGAQFGTPGEENDVCGAPCLLTIGSISVNCETNSPDIDLYTTTINFSNGGTEDFQILVNEGTVSGENPSTDEDGKIIVSGITEGTNLMIIIKSDGAGTCFYNYNIDSPVCDFYDPDCVSIGSLIFTEIMQNPSAVTDSKGEWFELHNTLDVDVDLHGYNIIDDDHTLEEEGFTIGQTLIIPANGYLVFAVNGDNATNGGIDVDWEYGSSISLGNGTDGLSIQCDGNIIDVVVWDNGSTFPDPNGYSMSLNPSNYNNIDNDNGANWCEAISQYGEDFGTPGNINDVCPADCPLDIGEITTVCDSLTNGVDTYTSTVSFTGGGSDDYTISTSKGTVSGDSPSSSESGSIIIEGVDEGGLFEVTISSGLCDIVFEVFSPNCDSFDPDCVNLGDLIFTEVMQNPTAVSDDNGEWFELHNTTSEDIDLHGYVIIDDNHTLDEEGFVISETLIITAGGFLVFANNGDFATNGGFDADWVYGTAVSLGNGLDGLVLMCSGELLDQLVWDGGSSFPDPNGKSMSLSPAKFNNDDNDIGENWCEAVSQFGEDYGTPGANNDDCAVPCDLEFADSKVACDAITDGDDTYTATLDFIGGSTQVYTIEVSSGTIGGDNPSSVETGAIVVTGIVEGTDVTIDVSGGTCELTRFIQSAVCVEAVCAEEGSIILTEVMQNPAAVSDVDGEWFEVFNTTSSAIDLKGWDFLDDNNVGEGFIVPSTLVIPAGGYLVFANNGDSDVNGGVNPDFVYNPVMSLGNGDDGLSIDCKGNVIDVVIWDDGATFPDPAGESMALATDHMNATDNNEGMYWGTSSTIYGDGDNGTPGSENDFAIAIFNSEIVGLQVYPNPVIDGLVHIVTDSQTKKSIALYDLLGAKLYEGSFDGTTTELQLETYTAGLYLLKISQNEQTSTVRLIVE